MKTHIIMKSRAIALTAIMILGSISFTQAQEMAAQTADIKGEGQSAAEYRLKDNAYSIQIKGTSNVHDWTMKAEKMEGVATVDWGQQGPADFNKVHITVQAKTLESGKRIMNNKSHDALKVEQYPAITFELISVSELQSNGKKFSGKATGTMKIAGESSIMTVPFQGKILDKDTFRVEGNFSLKMKEFGIKPPKAMLGTLKTGNEVTLSYQMTFNQ